MNAQSDKPRFDIALALAGTFSAGAYTAGVLDFLIEALDAWHNSNTEPPHNVVVQAASGASGGAVCSTLLAAMLRYEFSHMRRDDTSRGLTRSKTNPLFDFWVDRIDLPNFLGPDDLNHDAHAMSVLDATKLDTILRDVLGYGGKRVRRSYIADPFRLRFTLTNLRGVPYRLSMNGGSGEAVTMMLHEDHKRFALTDAGGFTISPPPWPSGDWRHESIVLHPPDDDDDKYTAWRELVDAALASCALPFLLRSRTIHKEAGDYAGRPLLYADGKSGPAKVYPTMPAWGGAPPSDHGFATADGGVMYDVPLEHARLALVGDDPLARNVPAQTYPDRAVLLISPLVGGIPEGPCSESSVTLLNALARLFNAYKNNARAHPSDLMLANDRSVGRFLIAPKRDANPTVQHEQAIACGALGGFGGYLALEFREHDYYLGRRNCQRFLDQHFSLPANHALFRCWSDTVRKDYLLTNGELPIVPLLGRLRPPPRGDAKNVEPLPDWPRDKCKVEKQLPLIGNRADYLYGKLSSEVKLLGSIWLRLGWRLFGRRRLLSFVRKQIVNGLRAHQLR